jgi:2-keto-4-pentenoate hydratase
MDRGAQRVSIHDLRQTKRPVAALPADIVPRTLAEGYEVQDGLVRKLLEVSGGHPIGYKIACTSELAQKALGVDRPFFGILLSHSTYRSPATVKGSDFTIRCAEAEFGFEMGADVPAGPVYTADSIESSSGRRCHPSRS